MANVLLVDDDPDVLTMVSLALELEGHRVIPAVTRAQANEVIAKGEPDIVVTDSMLRGGNGDDVAKAADRAGLPVIIISGEPERVKRHEIGDRPFLSKPFEPQLLVATIQMLLRKPRPAS